MGKSKVEGTQAQILGELLEALTIKGQSDYNHRTIKLLKKYGWRRPERATFYCKGPIALDLERNRVLLEVKNAEYGTRQEEVFHHGYIFVPGPWYFYLVDDLKKVLARAENIYDCMSRLKGIKALEQRQRIDAVDFSSWEA